jgi:hypothetical protein
MENISKREFLAASIGAGITLSAVGQALAQEKSAGNHLPSRKVKTTKLFKSPDGYPNAIAVTP